MISDLSCSTVLLIMDPESNVFSCWKVWTAGIAVQRLHFSTVKPCIRSGHRKWFSIVLLKGARSSLKKVEVCCLSSYASCSFRDSGFWTEGWKQNAWSICLATRQLFTLSHFILNELWLSENGSDSGSCSHTASLHVRALIWKSGFVGGMVTCVLRQGSCPDCNSAWGPEGHRDPKLIFNLIQYAEISPYCRNTSHLYVLFPSIFTSVSLRSSF